MEIKTDSIFEEIKEISCLYFFGKDGKEYSMTETPDGHFKIILLTKGRLNVQPSSNNSIELA